MSTTKILITGSTGLLGQALLSRLSPRADVTGLSRHPPKAGGRARHVTCDLLDPERTTQVVQACAPDIVINAQAMSDVDQCEREPSAAFAMNVTTVQHLVQSMAKRHALLVHMSTDYVFDGAKRAPYDEADTPRPISVYGRSKLAGEQVVLGYPRGVVVRTSTLFGPGRMNFCDYLAARLQAAEPVEAFIDQVTSPTYTQDLAEALEALALTLAQAPQGKWTQVYHLANAGACSRVMVAERVADLLGCPRELIRRIPMAEQRRPAARPPYSALTSRHVPRVVGRTMRPWHEALDAYLDRRQPTRDLTVH